MIRKFYEKHKQYLIPALNLTKKCLQDVVEMREKPNFIDYVNLGMSFKENYDQVFRLRDPYNYFANHHWKYINGSENLNSVVFELIRLEKNPTSAIVVDEAAAFIANINGVRFGCVTYEDACEKLYVEASAADTYPKVLEQAFWNHYKTGGVVLGMKDDRNVYLREDLRDDFFVSPKANYYAEYIQSYMDHGLGRSFLFYGPPGSGKSNLVKSISGLLNLKTIRINNLSQLSVETTLDLLRIFNPDALVLEDIDNVDVEEISDLLDKVETFNKRQKLTVATANQVSRLDNALIRPGRFDEVVEINHLEEEVVGRLVGHDPELLEITKNFPAAFTQELMKRIKVRGREEALQSLSDLTDRIENFETANYGLKKNKMVEDEEEDG